MTQEDISAVLETCLGRQGVHVGADIPDEKLARARQQCDLSPDEPVLGMIDFTMLGSGKHALVFAPTCAYYHNAPAGRSPGPGRIAYDELPDRQLGDGGLFEVSLGDDQFLNVSGPGVTKEAVIDVLQALRERIAPADDDEPEAQVDQAEIDEAEDDEAGDDQAEVDEAEVDQAEVDEAEVDEAEDDEAGVDEVGDDEAESDTPESPTEEGADAPTFAKRSLIENDASDAERGRAGAPSGTQGLGYGLANLRDLISTDALKSDEEGDDFDESWQDGLPSEPTTAQDPPPDDDNDAETPVMLEMLDDEDEDDPPAAPVKLELLEPLAPPLPGAPGVRCPKCDAGPDTYKTVHFGSEEVLRCMACGYRDSDDGEDAVVEMTEVDHEPGDDESEIVPLTAVDRPGAGGAIPQPKRGISVGACTGLVFLAIVVAWLLIVTLAVLAGSGDIQEYLLVMAIGVGVLLVLSALGAMSAHKAGKSFPEFSRTEHLDGDSYCIRDEAAIRLAILFEYGGSSHFIFRNRIERFSAGVCILGSTFLEIISWVIVLVVPGPVGLVGAFMRTGGLAGKAARTLRARPLTARLRWLYKRDAFSDADIQRAGTGMLPSDPNSVWCVAGIDGPVYVLTRGEGEIIVRTLGKADQSVLPLQRLAGSALAVFTRKQKRKNPQLYGFGSIVWEIPRVLEKGGPLHLNASLHRGALHTLSAWKTAGAPLAQPPAV